LRWHPLRGESVAYATHRQMRTFLGLIVALCRRDDAASVAERIARAYAVRVPQHSTVFIP